MLWDKNSENMLHVIDHPLVQHKLTLLRDKETNTPCFRKLLREIGLLMGYEVTRGLPIRPQVVETPMARCEGGIVFEDNLVVVPILRAGLGMAEGLMELIPGARVGHMLCELQGDADNIEQAKLFLQQQNHSIHFLQFQLFQLLNLCDLIFQ